MSKNSVTPSASPRWQRISLLDVPFDLLDYRQAYDVIRGWSSATRRDYVCITNPHSVMLCQRDQAMQRATLSAGLTLADGMGIVLAARLWGRWHTRRTTGPELMLRVCDWGRGDGLRHFFLGGAPGVPERLAVNLSAKYPGLRIVGTHSPPFRPLTPEEDLDLVTQINRSHADILWVGLGAPKQEKWMAQHVGQLQATAMIGVGAAFDFHSGNVPWAPAWMRRMGLEWVHRLSRDPRRMWRKDLDSLQFLGRVMWQRWGGKAQSPLVTQRMSSLQPDAEPGYERPQKPK